jgi:hypothetical protein
MIDVHRVTYCTTQEYNRYSVLTTTMMFHQWISMGTTVLLAIASSVLVATSRCTVDCFTLPSTPTVRIYATTSQSYDRALVISDATSRPTVENSSYDSFNAVSTLRQKATSVLAATIATIAIVTLTPLDAWADGQTKDFKFPPIDYGDVNRCVLKGGSSMGQANAARDKLYDLRQCKLSGVDATGYDLSGVST